MTQAGKAQRSDWVLRALLILYLAASLLHFTHNAENVQDYPNLPQWISRASVYLAWLSLTAVGALGFLLYRARRNVSGLMLLGLYAAAGLDGLLHYTLAPIVQHTHTMNFTILFEVVVASVLLIAILFKAALIDRGRILQYWTRGKENHEDSVSRDSDKGSGRGVCRISRRTFRRPRQSR